MRCVANYTHTHKTFTSGNKYANASPTVTTYRMITTIHNGFNGFNWIQVAKLTTSTIFDTFFSLAIEWYNGIVVQCTVYTVYKCEIFIPKGMENKIGK